MNKKKNLIAILSNHADDIYCFRKELIEEMIHAGYNILIVCPYGNKMKLMRKIPFLYKNIDIDRRGMNVINDIKLFFNYYNILRKYNPDFLLCYTIKPNIYASYAATLLHIPYINNITGLGSFLNKPLFLQSSILYLYRIALKKSNCVFFQNIENREYFNQKNIINGHSRIIPGSGVNTKKFRLQPYPKDDIIIFNYIGRILKDKGIDDYLFAAKKITQKYTNVRFNVIGFVEPSETYYFQKLKKFEEEKIITYCGNQNDIRPFIANSHATIHPSTYGEGMSNVLLESASSGRPLITTNIAGCRETVKDGITGYIYPAGNVNALIKCIEKFLKIDNNSRKEMGLNGRAYVEKNFSRQLVIKAYLEELQN